MGVSVTGWFFPASAGRTLKGRGSNSAAFCIVFSAPRISRESLDDIASRVRWIITEPSRIDWSYQPLFQRQTQCCIKPMQKKPFQRWSERLGCGHAIELAGRAGPIAGLGCPPQAMLMQRLKDLRPILQQAHPAFRDADPSAHASFPGALPFWRSAA